MTESVSKKPLKKGNLVCVDKDIFLNSVEALASDKKADFDMLNNLTENNKWIIVDQTKDDSSLSSYKVLLRRKIQS